MVSKLANIQRIRDDLDWLRDFYNHMGSEGFSQAIDVALGIGATLSCGLNPTGTVALGVLHYNIMMWGIQATGGLSITNTQTINGAVTVITQGFVPLIQVWPIVTAGAVGLTGAVLNIGDNGVINTIDARNVDVAPISVRITCRAGTL